MKTVRAVFSLNDLTRSALMLLCIGGMSLFTADAGVKDEAAKVFMNFGSCSGSDPARMSFVARIKSDYNILVCENAMKFQPTEPSQGNFSYSGGDAVVNFCTANNMLVRGHTMVWHAQTSTWIQSFARAQMLAAMKNHIMNVMGHWKGKILEWDVVNEAVSDAGNALRSSFWQKNIGNDFIDSAFVYAHQADPNAYLYYNDYGTEGMNSKANYVYTMVQGMLQRGIPIHGVGLQCHVSSNLNKSQISQNIKRLGDLGLRVSLTEIDIKSTTAAAWSNLVGAAVENYNATTVMCWGFDDNHSWLGSNCNCQMWDGSGNPKADVVAAVETAFNTGDATIAAKRKTFAAISPTGILRGMGKPAALNLKEAQRFTFNNGALLYFLPATQEARLQIFDMQGKVAMDLNMGRQAAGTHTVQLPGRRLTAGIYVARINSGQWSGRFSAY